VDLNKEVRGASYGDEDTLTSISKLASVLQFQGKYEAVEEMDRRTLERREKVLRKRHSFTPISVNNLTSILPS